MLNRLWQVWILAVEKGLAPEELFFDISDTYSPYMEVTLKNLGCSPDKNLEPRIAVNPFFCWNEIFAPLLENPMSIYEPLTLSLSDLILHHIARVDASSGMTKEEYCRRLIAEDITNGVFGEKEAADSFSDGEKRRLGDLILALYRTGEVLYCFEEAVTVFFPGSQILLQEEHTIFLYLRAREGKRNKGRISFLIHLFLCLDDQAKVYWDYFPGVIGKDETMKTGDFIIG